MNTYVYRGKWRRDLIPKLHLYNPGLPVGEFTHMQESDFVSSKNVFLVLMVDRLGYIRWHAVGLPTEKTLRTALPLLRQLIHEKNER